MCVSRSQKNTQFPFCHRCTVRSVQTWEERVDALVDSSEWLSALALSLDNYDAHASAHRESVDAAEKKAKAAAAKGGDGTCSFGLARAVAGLQRLIHCRRRDSPHPMCAMLAVWLQCTCPPSSLGFASHL